MMWVDDRKLGSRNMASTRAIVHPGECPTGIRFIISKFQTTARARALGNRHIHNRSGQYLMSRILCVRCALFTTQSTNVVYMSVKATVIINVP